MSTPPPSDDGKEPEQDPITIDEVTQIAKKKLSEQVWNYYASGADDQLTVRRNEEVYNRLFIRPRTMRDVSSIDTSITFLGTKYPIPIGIAPSAMQKLAGGAGELDVAAAARSLGLNMTLSSQSTTTLEEVIQINQKSAAPDTPITRPPGDFWFQIYLTQDLDRSISLIKRAEAAGYTALVITIDTPVLGNRLNERKTPLALPDNLTLANLEPPTSTSPTNSPQSSPSPSSSSPSSKKPTTNRLLMDARTKSQATSILASSHGSTHSSSLTWKETLPWLRSITTMKLILKGIMTSDDARLARKFKADAIIVSNHGGRQLDGCPSTLEVLPSISKAIKKRLPIIFDGGVRRGSDVFKALALGANLVLVGRPVLWGLAYQGQEGVECVMNILERELSRTMALAGTTKVRDITRHHLAIVKNRGFGMHRL